MSSQIPDHPRNAAEAKARDALQPGWRVMLRVVTRALVYAGIIGASILIWWAIGRLFIG